VTFDKSLYEYYTKFFAVQSGKAERSDFHSQFRIGGQQLQPNFKRVEKPLLRTKNKGTLCKLGKYMMLLVQIIHKVVEQTDKYKNTVK